MNFKLIKSICLLGVTLILTAAVVPWCARPTPTPTPPPGYTAAATATPVSTATPVPVLQIDSPENEQTFVSTDQLLCSSHANVPGIAVSWSIYGAQGQRDGASYNTSEIFEQANTLTFQFQPNPASAPNGRGEALGYQIYAKTTVTGNNYEEYVWIEQDSVDQCRQEYIDMEKDHNPTRADFIDSRASTNFSLFQLSKNSHYTDMNTREVKAIFIQGELTNALEVIREGVEHPLTINNGFRNPRRQNELSPNSPEGKHQYGAAADISIEDFDGDKIVDKDDWYYIKQIVLDETNACIEPYNYTGEDRYDYIHVHIPNAKYGEGVCPTSWR